MQGMIGVGKRYLVTTNDWFRAPDGDSYKAVFGTVKAIHSDVETLGIKTNARSTNWYLEIGNMIVAGCQIHYACRCDAVYLGESNHWTSNDKGIVRSKVPSFIYNADGEPA